MKNAIITLNLVLLSLVAQAETKFELEISKKSEKGTAAHAIQVILKPKGDDTEVPPLQVDLPARMRTRITGVKFEKAMVAIVLQYDEFHLEYREYTISSGKWTLASKRKICELNGYLSTSLKKVQIRDFGEIEVTFGKETVPAKPLNWDKEIIEGTHAPDREDIIETYSIKKDGRVVKSGDRNRFRGNGAE